ncbi:MAG: hypothetical protein CFH41_01664 [Alphaproteobacteria bacterium MarineAlpha11_Bin1]|nr:MAG: hypothetical protein CFH41_01664 [Alphaproteobacteria bacterium MarineAlpha11_Bin1]|tara:strand:- start:7313 stop:7597 length:285 start_codon:yes stop_codon:yes gene_type:complete
MNDPSDEQERSTINDLQDVMKRLSLAINVAETVMAKSAVDYIPNALLNITISRIIAAEGKANTANLLSTLAQMISDGVDPEKGGPVRLSRTRAD